MSLLTGVVQTFITIHPLKAEFFFLKEPLFKYSFFRHAKGRARAIVEIIPADNLRGFWTIIYEQRQFQISFMLGDLKKTPSWKKENKRHN